MRPWIPGFLVLIALFVACGERPPAAPLVDATTAERGAASATQASTPAPFSPAAQDTSPAQPQQARIRLSPALSAPVPDERGVPPPQISALSAVVLDEASAAILFEKDAHLPLPPASLAKIATAAVVIAAGGLGDEVDAHPDLEREWLEDSQTMGLEPGDRLTVTDLLYGLLLMSGNDAAEALAEHVAGDQQAFVLRMNALAASLGLAQTQFVDASGLSAANRTSAYDLAILSRYAMSSPVFRELVGTEQHEIAVANGAGSRHLPLYNWNPLLNYTPGVDGIKTGYTEEAGKTFVVSATRGGHRVYVVLLNDNNQIADAIALIEWAFADHTWAN